MLGGVMAGNVKTEKMQVIPVPCKEAVNLKEERRQRLVCETSEP
jgi:hypothetical protein